MTSYNRLINETSPYLLQHAHNPVNWYPWCDEALALAKSQDKPILLSIGYAACHWCHVMAHESFEDEATATLMNKLFINIKVDKEERPDIDKVYQQLHQVLIRQGGGWPLTVFLAPDDLMPFYSGTYFPKERHFSRPSFQEICQVISDFYLRDRTAIHEQNQQLAQAIAHLEKPADPYLHQIKMTPLIAAKGQWLQEFDKRYGGFQGAPKFPMPAVLSGILYLKDDELLQCVLFSLDKMAQGGLYDHLGGGFFRYCVDEKWQIPHFEKMLYDNAQMIGLYAQGYAFTHNENLKEVALECIDWASFEMHSKEGGFYSSLDADSEGEEGKYYAWDKSEFESLLDENEFEQLKKTYELNETPNFEHKWHLVQRQNKESLSLSIKEKLINYRASRVRPGLDDKILCSWNALMLKSLSISSIIFQDNVILQQATQLIQFIKDTLFYDNKLWVTYSKGQRKQSGFLDDYAYLLDACWYYLQAHWDAQILAFAKTIADILMSDFWDKEQGGFHFTSKHHERLILRVQSWIDDVMPAGASVAALALHRFGSLLNRVDYTEMADKSLSMTQGLLEQNARYYPTLLVLQSEYLSSPAIVIIQGKAELVAYAKELLFSAYIPNRFVFALDESIPAELKQYESKDDLSIYICSGNVCGAPLKSIKELKDYLK